MDLSRVGGLPNGVVVGDIVRSWRCRADGCSSSGAASTTSRSKSHMRRSARTAPVRLLPHQLDRARRGWQLPRLRPQHLGRLQDRPWQRETSSGASAARGATSRWAPAPTFAWQHDARRHGPTASGHALRRRRRTAGPPAVAGAPACARHHADAATSPPRVHPRPGGSLPALGSTQPLPGRQHAGRLGDRAMASEYTDDGSLVFDAHQPVVVHHYRVRDPVDARPTGLPAIAAHRPRGHRFVHASWNGATEVHSWRFETGPTASSLPTVAATRRTGFETSSRHPPTRGTRRSSHSTRTANRSPARRQRTSAEEGAEPPHADEGAAGVEHDQVFTRSEGIRRAGHRLDGQAAPGDVRQRVAGEQHQPAVALVHPQREPAVAVRLRSSTRATPSASRSRSVNAWSSRVVPIGLGCRKSCSVPSTAARPVGMPCASECSTVRPRGRAGGPGRPSRSRPSDTDGRRCRTGTAPAPTFVAVVWTRRPAGRERVFDRQLERERIAGPRMQLVAHDDPVRLALGHRPALPADEAVDRVAGLRLVERQLVAAPSELVRSALQPVRPRHQHLPAARRAQLGGVVARRAGRRPRPVRPQPSAHLDDDGPLLAELRSRSARPTARS